MAEVGTTQQQHTVLFLYNDGIWSSAHTLGYAEEIQHASQTGKILLKCSLIPDIPNDAVGDMATPKVAKTSSLGEDFKSITADFSRSWSNFRITGEAQTPPFAK